MNTKRCNNLDNLVTEFEALSESGEFIPYNESELLSLIHFYESNDQLPKAIKVANFAIDAFPYQLDFYIQKAHILIALKEMDEAIKILNEAEHIAPSNKELLLLKSDIFSQLNLPNMALDVLDEAKEKAPKKHLGCILYQEALVYEQSEQYECMFYALKAAIMANPRHDEALQKLWHCIVLSKNHKHSIKFHKEVLDIDPFSFRAWYNLGHSYSYLSKYEKAIEAYEFAIAINEHFEPAYQDCAELCVQMKWYHKALKWYLEIAENFYPDNEVIMNIGRCYQQLGQYNTALTFFQRALQLNPLSDEAYYNIGLCNFHYNKFKSAAIAFEKALQIEDTREDYFLGLAETYHLLELPILAEQNFQEALDLAPDNLSSWVKYIRFLLDNREKGLIFNVLDEANDYVGGVELMYCKAGCLFELDRRKEAFYWLIEAMNEDFDKHSFLFEFCPELANDPEVLSLITVYMAP